MEEEIARAIRLGEANKEVIELLQNWCSHLVVERSEFSGVGLVEMQTGLPIGHRRIRCPHASNRGWEGAVLEGLALQFHDDNCRDCDQRAPVRLPNLTKLLGARDRRQAQQDQLRRDHEAKEAKRLGTRKARREEVRKGTTETGQLAVLNALAEFDDDPSSDRGQHLKEVVKAAGGLGSQVEALLVELGNDGGRPRASTSLEILHDVGASSPAVLEAALNALARREVGDPASAVVEHQVRPGLDPKLVRSATPYLVFLAASRSYPGLSHLPPRSGGLLALARMYPSEVEAVLRSLIRDRNKEQRSSAIECLRSLMTPELSLVERLLPDVCSSVELPDDVYNRGYAADEAAKTLAAALIASPRSTDPVIQKAAALAQSKGKARLLKAYVEVLDDWWRNNHEPDAVSGDVYHLAYDRIVEQFATRSGDDVFVQAVDYFDSVAGRCPLNVGRINALTGIIALLSSDLEGFDEAKSTTVIELQPDRAAVLDAMTKRSRLQRGLRVAADAVSGAAVRSPDVVIKQVQSTFDSVDDGQSLLRAYLVKCLKGPASLRCARRALLPFLYRAMLDTSPLVRNASIEVVKELTTWDVDDLPATFCDCFLALLSDSYVIVHQAAVRILRYRWTVPDEYVERILNAVWGWVAAYARSRSDDEFLAQAINTVFYLTLRLGRSLSAELLVKLFGVLRMMHAPAAFDVLEDRWEAFRDVPGFSAFVVDLLGDPALNDYNQRDLIKLLPHVDAVEASVDVERVWKAFAVCAGRGLYEASMFLDMLTRAGHWDAAKIFTQRVVNRYEENAWDQRVRNMAMRLQTAVEIEAGLPVRDDSSVTNADAWASFVEDGDG